MLIRIEAGPRAGRLLEGLLGLVQALTALCGRAMTDGQGDLTGQRRLILATVASDTQKILVSPKEVDAAGVKTPLGSLTPTPDDPAKVSVVPNPDPDRPGTWFIQRLSTADGPLSGVVTFADADAGISGQFAYEFDPSKPASVVFDAELVPVDQTLAAAPDGGSTQAAT